MNEIVCPFCGQAAALLYGTVTPPRPDKPHDMPRDYRWWFCCKHVIADQSSTGEHWENVRMFYDEMGEKREWMK